MMADKATEAFGKWLIGEQTTDEENAEIILDTLITSADTKTRSELRVLGFNDRQIRGARRASGGRIISTPHGYVAMVCATDEQVSASWAMFNAQIRGMCAESDVLWGEMQRRQSVADAKREEVAK